MLQLSDRRVFPPPRRRAADVETIRRLARRDTLHLGHIERLLAQAQAERFWWLERDDALAGRPDGGEDRLRTALDRMLETRLISRRQPWWRRWFG